MDDEQKKQPEDRPERQEVVTDFGDVRVRSGFEVEEQGPGMVSFNIFGPIFEFPDSDQDLDDDLDLDEDEGDDQP